MWRRDGDGSKYLEVLTLQDLAARIAADVERERSIDRIKRGLQTALALLAFCVMVGSLGFAIGFAIGQQAALGDCPQEDSCYADYYEGAWHIVPGERPEQWLYPN